MIAYLYVLNTMADWEIGYLTAEINSGRFLDKSKTPARLVKIGNTTGSIITMGGITIVPDESIDTVVFNEGDLLILPGADTWLDENNKRIIDRIPELLSQNVTVAAICGATAALAKKGILNDKKHTSNDMGYLKMSCPEYSGENYYLNQPAVIDNNLITASGLAPLEFTCEIFKKTNIMKTDTREAWYQLFKNNDPKYFPILMESLDQ